MPPRSVAWSRLGVPVMTVANCSVSPKIRSADSRPMGPRDWKSRFLEGLGTPDLQVVISASKPRHFVANSIVTNQGDAADYFFLLTRGCARYFFITEEGRKVLIRWFTAGDVFGGAALLPAPCFYLLSTEMVKDSSALVWHTNVIRDLMVRYPTLLENALCIASDYLTWFHASHMALVSHAARQRLARVLTSLAAGIGRRVPAGVELEITNEELANAANVTSFTTSRLLSEWRRNGALSKKRGSIVLHAPQRLLLHPL